MNSIGLRQLCVVVGILGLSPGIYAECERIYRYSYSGVPIEDWSITVHVPDARSTQGRVYTGSDTSLTSEFCTSDSEYLCFLPLFAVPKQFDGLVRKWTLGDTTFEIVREIPRIRLLGRQLDGLYAIKASRNDENSRMKPWEFLYSPRSGLISFTTGVGTAWLTDEVGFGALEPGPASYPEWYRRWNYCPTSDPSSASESGPAEKVTK